MVLKFYITLAVLESITIYNGCKYTEYSQVYQKCMKLITAKYIGL